MEKEDCAKLATVPDVVLTPAVISVDFAAVEAKVAEALAEYDGVTADDLQKLSYKEAKAERAFLNGLKGEIEDARKAIKREYNKPLQAFEAECRRVEAAVDEPLAIVSGIVDGMDRAFKEERAAFLAGAYLEFCEGNGVPTLAENVPFDRLMDKAWLNSSTSVKKATDQMEAKAAGVIAGWRVLDGANLACKRETLAHFFATLSVESALDFDAEHAAELERMEQMETERAAAKGYQARETEAEGVFEWTCEFAGTTSQAQKLAAFCSQMGVRGRIRKGAQVG